MTDQDRPKLGDSLDRDPKLARSDLDPSIGEAEAQSEATLMPWIWGGVGLVLIAVFVAWAIFAAPHSHIRQPAAAAPVIKPPNQTY